MPRRRARVQVQGLLRRDALALVVGALDDVGADDFDVLGPQVARERDHAVLHHRAVEIHPFVNGNGRWGRMLTNIWLALRDNSYVAWPEETIGAESPIRGDYIRALRQADAGDIEPLLKMHRRYLAAQE